MSMELRWFFDGPLPATVEQWCLKKSFLPEKTRTDVYLVLDVGGDLGVKIREREKKKFFEIKYRLSSEPFQAEKYQISGIIEKWKKASTLIESEDTEPLKEVKALARIAVKKTRYNRKFVVDTITRKVEPAEARVEQGLIMEVTDLSVALGKELEPYWTLGFDALGDNQKETLHFGVPNIMADCPLRNLQKGWSISYPEFIVKKHKNI